jgi:hypothetical protein
MVRFFQMRFSVSRFSYSSMQLGNFARNFLTSFSKPGGRSSRSPPMRKAVVVRREPQKA